MAVNFSRVNTRRSDCPTADLLPSVAPKDRHAEKKPTPAGKRDTVFVSQPPRYVHSLCPPTVSEAVALASGGRSTRPAALKLTT